MTLGSLVITVLRILHIFGAVTWIGGAIFLASVLSPTVREAGPEGGRFMMRLAALGRMSRNITMAAVTTIVAGLLLYWPTSGGLNGAWLSSAHGITLTIGAIFGLLTFFHGLFVTGRASARMGVVAKEILAVQGPPPADKLKEAQALGAKLGQGGMLTAIMGSLALLFMAAAQTI